MQEGTHFKSGITRHWIVKGLGEIPGLLYLKLVGGVDSEKTVAGERYTCR